MVETVIRIYNIIYNTDVLYSRMYLTVSDTVCRIAQEATGWHIRRWLLTTTRPMYLLAMNSRIYSAENSKIIMLPFLETSLRYSYL